MRITAATMVLLAPAMAAAQFTYIPPPPPPNPMVWQQGINNAEDWQELGCPRDYESDADKDEMIRAGLCSAVNPDGTPKPPASVKPAKPDPRRSSRQ